MELAFDAVMTTFDAGVRTSLQSLADTNDDLAAELNIPPGGQVVITGLQVGPAAEKNQRTLLRC